jgi:hypothetical protein
VKKPPQVKAINTQAIAEGTGTSWAVWCKKLDAENAKSLSHGEIVKVAQRIKPVSGWWAQGIAVAYEQHIGRRKPGQMSDGTYSASASRTVEFGRNEAFQKWDAFASEMRSIGGTGFLGTASVSQTPKRSYWKQKCEDGSKVIIGIEEKPNGRALIAVEHQKLKTEPSLATIKSAWVKALAECFEK